MPANKLLALKVMKICQGGYLRLIKSVVGLLFLIFITKVHAYDASHLLKRELVEKFSCGDREVEELCFLSSDFREGDLAIFMTSFLFRLDEFDKKSSSYDAAELTHKIYWSLRNRYCEISKSEPCRMVLFLDTIFRDERIVVVHDFDNTAYIGLEKRIDLYGVLNEHRDRVASSLESAKSREGLESGKIIFEKYDSTTTYDIVSADAVKDITTGEVTVVGEFGETGRTVEITRTKYFMAWFPKGDQP